MSDNQTAQVSRQATQADQIKTLVRAGDSDAALALCDRILAKAHKRPGIHVRRGRILIALQRPFEALAAFDTALSWRPDHVDGLAARAALHQTFGNMAEALQDYDALSALTPADAAPVNGAVFCLMRLDRHHDALARCRAHMKTHGFDARLAAKEGLLLRQIGDIAAAEQALTSAVARNAKSPFLRAKLAEFYLSQQDYSAADRCFANALALKPDHVPSWLGQVTLRQRQADLAGAVEVAQKADAACAAGETRVIERLAELLRQVGTPLQAVQHLEKALEDVPDHAGLLCALGQSYLSAGQPEAAQPCFDRAQAIAPGPGPALMGLVSCARARGGADDAQRLLVAALPLEIRTQDQAEVILRLFDLGFAHTHPEQTEALSAQISQSLHLLSLDQVVRLAECAIAAGDTDLLVHCHDHFGQTPNLPADVAGFVLKRAAQVPDGALHAAMADALPHKVLERARPEVAADAEALISGPAAALARLRAEAPSPRSWSAARAVARYLNQLGAKATHLRYVQACARRWPHAGWVQKSLLFAYHGVGRADAAAAFVASQQATYPERDLSGLKAQHVVRAGDPFLAFDHLIQRFRPADPVVSLDTWFQLATVAGDIDTATALLPRMKARPKTSRTQSAHFMITQLGARYNELVLFDYAARAAEAAGTPRAEFTRKSAALYVQPAQRVLQDWLASDPAPQRGAAVPRLIHQYWDKEQPPLLIGELMSDWATLPGFAHQRFTKRSAMSYLLDRFGKDHATAFTLANHIAEESDFFRLCALLAEGGVYIDADDRCLGGLGNLLDRETGAVVFREHFGALANNVICAPPGHPMIARAVDMAMAALLARESDNTWSKTGPGLLTRAAAAHLVACDKTGTNTQMTILPFHALRQFCAPHVRMPYKNTPDYWGNTTTWAEQTERDALRRFAGLA